jgi:hypothetical protein
MQVRDLPVALDVSDANGKPIMVLSISRWQLDGKEALLVILSRMLSNRRIVKALEKRLVRPNALFVHGLHASVAVSQVVHRYR